MRENDELTSIRPLIAIEPAESALEIFQNEVLRPILKYQQELWKSIILGEDFLKNALSSGKTQSEKWRMVMKLATKNPSLKYQWVGMVTGLMTNEEFTYYYRNKKELDKRIMSMLAQRLVDSH